MTVYVGLGMRLCFLWQMLNLKNLFWNAESEPYNKAFNKGSSSKLIIKGSIRQWSSWRFCLSLGRIWQCKKKVFNCYDFSASVTYGAYTIFDLNVKMYAY